MRNHDVLTRALATRSAATRRTGNWLSQLLLTACLTAVFAGGCNFRRFDFKEDQNFAYYENMAKQPVLPEGESIDPSTAITPRSLRTPGSSEFWDLSLEEAIRLGLSQSEVMRDLQARVITNPASAATLYDPAIAESNPQFGVEAALSQFDPVWTASVSGTHVDQPLNVQPVFGLVPVSQQQLMNAQTQLSKRAATGALFNLRNITDYSATNQPTNRFPSAWTNNVEAEMRQPLLQGAGVNFNRIAGPGATPGFFFANGVVLARITADVAQHDFERSVIVYLSDVENAYWELSFAYRNLDAARAARDAALETWRRVHALYLVGRVGGEAENEAQAREQLFTFEAQVQDALAGSTATAGVFASERRLRRLLRLPQTDGRLIRPSDEPLAAQVTFDWAQLVNEAVVRRVELRRQRLQIRSREMQMVAARNFLLPQLDAVALYRWRGFGDDLTGAGSPGSQPFNSAFGTLFDGNYQDWSTGLQFSMPLGFRRAMANMRNVRLQIAREQAILRDEEEQVAFELSNAMADSDRAFTLVQTNLNRRKAAQEQVAAVQAAYDVGRATLDLLVRTQQVRAQAEVAFFRSVTDYALAIKNIHVAKGSLLDYDGVGLAEGPWPADAYLQAEKIQKWDDRISYVFSHPQRQDAQSCDPAIATTPEIDAAPQQGPTVAPEAIPAPGVDAGQPTPGGAPAEGMLPPGGTEGPSQFPPSSEILAPPAGGAPPQLPAAPAPTTQLPGVEGLPAVDGGPSPTSAEQLRLPRLTRPL